MLFILLACSKNTDSADLFSITLDSGLQKENSLSLIYDGESFPNAHSLHINTAPAGLQHTHSFTFQVSNLTEEALSLNCDQDWEREHLFISVCPDIIAPNSSAPFQISFSPQAESNQTIIDVPISFPEQGYQLFLFLHVPQPLITLFWGNQGYLLRSIDYGQSFEEVFQENTEWAHSISWGNGWFLRTSSASNDWSSEGIYELSSDGQHWTPVQGSQDIGAADCDYGLSRFVCTRADSISWISSEQQIYHEQSFGALEHHAIVFAEDSFVAVGRNGRRSRSEDGQHWSQESFPNLGDDYLDITYAKEQFVAVGGQDRFLVSWSNDGVFWQDRVFPPTIGARLERVLFDGQRIIISGSGTAGENILYTEDFQLWDPLRQQDPDLQMLVLGFLNGRYLGMGNRDGQRALYHSGDGMEWTLAHELPTGITVVDYAAEEWQE